MSENQCVCVLVIGLYSASETRHIYIDRRDCPKHSQAAIAARWAAKPLCHQDPCNDPECRLDHDRQD